MQSARTATLKLKQPLKQSLKRLTPHQQSRKMSFFPGTFLASPSASNNNTSFHPLFRLLDDFEQHSRTNDSSSEGHPHRQSRSIMKSFTPKFDVKELAEAYELHGDLPGIEQKDIEIEFTDIQTINIRGRTERSYTSGNPPSGFIEGSSSPAAIEGSEQHNKPTPRKASVEDEDAVMATDPANNSTEVITTKNNDNKEVSKDTKEEPKAKYWVSERSVGEFSRSFTFPVRVDQEAVTASMKNGVLTITVPKAKKNASKKISITSH